jgi:Na+-transporting methylmalonyl-CoA/oxaloacetate decarboxylase gamma subunit
MGTALAITAIGMTLLFLTLAFFYGLLSAMARFIEDRRSGNSDEAVVAPDGGDADAPLRAAAIAVALARAGAEERAVPRGAPLPPQPSPGPSPWWAAHHQRRLGPNPGVRRPQ